jgi:hypothetical protein
METPEFAIHFGGSSGSAPWFRACDLDDAVALSEFLGAPILFAVID